MALRDLARRALEQLHELGRAPRMRAITQLEAARRVQLDRSRELALVRRPDRRRTLDRGRFRVVLAGALVGVRAGFLGALVSLRAVLLGALVVLRVVLLGALVSFCAVFLGALVVLRVVLLGALVGFCVVLLGALVGFCA